MDVPVDDQLAGERIGEQHPQEVAYAAVRRRRARGRRPLLGPFQARNSSAARALRRAPAWSTRRRDVERGGVDVAGTSTTPAVPRLRRARGDARGRRRWSGCAGRWPPARSRETWMRRPCSSHVHQVSDTPASIATLLPSQAGYSDRVRPAGRPGAGPRRFTAAAQELRQAPVDGRSRRHAAARSRCVIDLRSMCAYIVHAFRRWCGPGRRRWA